MSVEVGKPQLVGAPPLGGAPLPVAASWSLRGEWKYWGTALGALLVLYLLLQHGLWAAGPDTAFYISIARDLAQGRGYTFGLVSVARAPPLWPLLLAGAMKISASFAFLNLVPMALILGSAAMWYCILRRLVDARRAMWAVLLCGMLFPWYSATTQLRSEALFCALLAGATLVGHQIGEGRAQWWRIALLCLLSMAMVGTRYAGLPAFAIVAAAVLWNQRRLEFNRQWLAAAIALVLTAATFVGVREGLKRLPNPQPEIPWVGPGGEGGESVLEQDGPIAVVGRLGPLSYLLQFLRAGQWTAGLLWMPLHVAVSNVHLGLLVNLFGWTLLAAYGAGLLAGVRRRQWLLSGTALYCAAVITRWGVVNPRYLMPVAPLILVGIWQGLAIAAATAGRPRLASLLRLAAPTFLTSLALCNLGLWSVDAWIARSGRFYHYYMAGELEELVSAARFLRTVPLRHGEVGVSERFFNLNRSRPNGFAMRGLVMLIGRDVRPVPNRYGDEGQRRAGTARRAAAPPPGSSGAQRRKYSELARLITTGEADEHLVNFAQFMQIRYYLYRPPASPWRAWHFRLPWLQRLVTGQTDIPESPGWELYEIRDGRAIRIDLPPADRWPTHVPGMQGDRGI
jgi:hypothetical protein